jgi:DNA polymerase V
MSYRRLLWDHVPLTDFWRLGRGYERKLHKVGIRTMGDIARCSLGREDEFYNEDLLYKLFGVNAELLIDHAWGTEPCTMADIKAYRPETNSLSSGQVLTCAYTAQKAKLVMREMTDLLVLDLVDKGLVTDQMVLTIGYDRENLSDPEAVKAYKGAIVTDHYGRRIPKHSHGTANLHRKTSSTRLITDAVMKLFDEIIDPTLLVRRINLTAAHVIPEYLVQPETQMFQLDLFADQLDTAEEETLAREKSRQKAVLHIQKKYGKNAIVKGMNLQEGATTMDRNCQIGVHKA